MKYLSICSGIEAASVAFHPLGWEAVAFSEIDPFPSAVLRHHYPDVPNLGDMTRYAEWPEEVFADADVIVGGCPCQAFSVAGLRGGVADARGNLTLVFIQLVNHADEVRRKHGRPPVVIVYENVPGLLNSRDNAFGCLLGALAGEDDAVIPSGKRWTNAGVVLGPVRSVAWRSLDAQYFHLAQRRQRVFVVASAGTIRPHEVLLEHEGVRRDSPPSRSAEQAAPAVAPATPSGKSHWNDLRNPHPTLNQSHNTGGIGASNQEVFAQRGSGLVPIAFGGNNTSGPIEVATARNACKSASGRMDFETETFIVTPVAFNHQAGGSLMPISPRVECANTIQAHQGQGVYFDPPTDRVRRITPKESERLQGFPDCYTQIPWRGKAAELCPEGPRQKALGNSMAVPCMSWLAKRIQRHLAEH